MLSIGFSSSSLTEEEAELIADAYFRGEKDPSQIAKHLGVEHFDLNLILHPLVKAKIVQQKREMTKVYSLEDHIRWLKKIRDGAFDAENWKVALASEISVGKAAGLYEPKDLGDTVDEREVDPKALSTDALRQRLLNVQRALHETPVTEPEPNDDSDLDENNLV